MTESEAKGNSIGTLSYIEASTSDIFSLSEQCSVGAFLSSDHFNSLLTAVQNGNLPDEILVKVETLDPGPGPGSKYFKWDISSEPNVNITDLRFRISLPV